MLNLLLELRIFFNFVFMQLYKVLMIPNIEVRDIAIASFFSSIM